MAEYKINYTQSNFTGGIIAAELYGRNDFNKVKSGLKKCTNWTIREAGGLEFRRGTRYLRTMPTEVNGQFKMASLDTMVFFFCEDGIRYLGDAQTWRKNIETSLIKPAGSTFRALTYGQGKFVALCSNGDVATSTDGANWSALINKLDDRNWSSLAYDGTKFVALSRTGYIATSIDAINWIDVGQISSYTQDVGFLDCLVYDGTKFLMLSSLGYLSVSNDGINWAPFEESIVLGNHGWCSVTHSEDKLVAIGNLGYVSVSTDGVTWTTPERKLLHPESTWEGVAYGNGKFIALDADGLIMTSADGIEWEDPNVNIIASFATSLIYGGDRFIALGGSRGRLLSSEMCVSILDDNWALLPYPEGVHPSLAMLQFTELNRKLYYYDSFMPLCEIGLYVENGQTTPITEITKFESSPSEATLSSELQGAAPDVHVDVLHEYTFALATDENHESIVSDLTTSQTANVELSQAATSGDNKAQQINVTVTLTNDLLNKYAGGKVLFYKKYQGYFYFLSALDLAPETLVYTYEDKGQNEVDTSKTPKKKPAYLQADGSIEGVNSIADYNQRLFLTRADQESTHIIFSETGNVDSLAYTLQRNEDEAGYLELPISNYDSWCKVVSGLDLILSTSYTLSRVSGYGDLTTETVLWDGFSKTVNPVRTRRSLIYTNSSNRNIYDLTYNEYGQYDSIDLTLLVKYIFETKTIKRLSFKDYPVKTIYVLCDDGDLYCLTYIKDQNIYAWYKLEHAGTIIDMCIVNTALEDEIYLVVKYGDEYIVERAYHRTDSVYMDCCVTRQLTEIENNTITGLDIFEGMTVRVFDTGNNLYYGDYDIMNPQTIVEGGKVVEIDDLAFNGFIVSNGQITLPSDVVLEGPIIIGLPYYAVMETIPLEFQDSNGNSTIGRKKAVNEAYLRYGDSRGLTYKTMGHEYDCGICSKDVEDNAQFLERGQVKLHTTSEYKWDSTIKILQRQPYPARIESVTLGITFNDKS